MVLMQVGANVIDALSRWLTGGPLGLLVPSYADFAGYFLAASSFLALAHTLKKETHIRVFLVVQRLGPRWRRRAEGGASGLGAGLTGYFSWYMAALVLQSWRFGDVSPGILPVPLWIPQAAMAVGLVILTIALVDTLMTVMIGSDGERSAGRNADPDPDWAPAAADRAAKER